MVMSVTAQHSCVQLLEIMGSDETPSRKVGWMDVL